MKIRGVHWTRLNENTDLAKVFNVPLVLNLPILYVPQSAGQCEVVHGCRGSIGAPPPCSVNGRRLQDLFGRYVHRR